MDDAKTEITCQEPAAGATGRNPRLVYLLMDSAFFAAGFFLCIEAALLRVENVTSMTRTVSTIVPFTACLFLSRAIYAKMFRKSLLFGLALEFTFVFLAVAGTAWLALQDPSSMNFSWLPYWWHRFPDMLLLFLRLSPLPAAALALAFILLVSLTSRNRTAIPAATAAALGIFLLLQYLFIMGRGSSPAEAAAILLLFALPATAAAGRNPRLFSRALLVCLTASFAICHSLGLLPLSYRKPFAALPGVTLHYPRPGTKYPVPPALVSDIAPVPAGRLLYAAGGRSAKILEIDTAAAAVRVKYSPRADFSKVAADPWNHNVYALDSAGAQVFRFPPGRLRNATSHSVATYWSSTPKDIIPFDTSMYITFGEPPGIAEFSVENFQEEGGVRIGNIYTPYRTGAWGVALVGETQGIYVAAGPPGPGHDALVLFIDPLRFQPVFSGIIPDAGPALSPAPRSGMIYSSSFFNNRIYETSAASLKPRRILPGPAAAALAFDPKRRLLFAAGRYDGVLAAVDTVSGRTVFSRFACKRITALELDRQSDRLWLACSKGIFSIDLPACFGEMPGGKTR